MKKPKGYIAIIILLVFASANILVYGQVETNPDFKADVQTTAASKEADLAPGQIADRNRSDSLKPSAIGGQSKADTEITKKKFPWLLVGGLIVAGTVAAVILLKKDKESSSTPPIAVPVKEPVMVQVPGGTFLMGSGNSYSNAWPIHEVTVSSFEIGKYEVTQKEWESVMGSNPSFFKGNYLPIEKVSWREIQYYIQKLNAATGKNYRLPTEAEWEYACRAGTTGVRYGEIDAIAWYVGNSNNVTHNIGEKTPNSFGLYDMLGNVAEWCSDWMGPYSSNPQTNPKGPSSGDFRVVRGGSYTDSSGYIESSYRSNSSPDDNSRTIGFRLAKD